MLVTDEFFPIPETIEVVELIGDRYTYETDENGSITSAVKGKHMILHCTAWEFIQWINCRTFWLFDEDIEKFVRIDTRKG